MSWQYCTECLKKQQKINRLEDENRQLKATLKYQKQRQKDGFFGSSTPSSKVPVKSSSLPERQERTGGAKSGHPGHGRQKLASAQADQIDVVETPSQCPECGGIMDLKEIRERSALDMKPVKGETVVFRVERRRCRSCGHAEQARPPGVLAKCQFGNGLMGHVAGQAYLYGVTLGQLEKQLGIGFGSLIKAMHLLSRLWDPVMSSLIRRYRSASVRHADETGWRTDGQNGYAWLFCTKELSLFRLRETRSASVVREVFGDRRLPGVLVVDRYAAYNQAPCALQYCYAHLLRDVKDLEKEFPDQSEVRCFVETVAPLLSAAMSLRGQGLSLREYRRGAKKIHRKLVGAMNRPARHLAIRNMQDLFRKHSKPLYHWPRGPTIPAENNLAERELRPLVVARKISFGSQSKTGAHTREVLRSVLHTLRNRSAHPAENFRAMLDEMAANPSAKPENLLFATHHPP